MDLTHFSRMILILSVVNVSVVKHLDGQKATAQSRACSNIALSFTTTQRDMYVRRTGIFSCQISIFL